MKHEDTRTGNGGRSSRWRRIAHWLMVDILPVLGLLLLMAWGMGLMSAEADQTRSSALAPTMGVLIDRLTSPRG